MVSKEIRQKLMLRKKIKKAKPRFKRQELGRQPLLKDTWRRPRGLHSKLRQHEKARGKRPSVGYGSLSAVRGLNRQGYREVRVFSPSQLEKLNPREEAAVISATVGKKKRFEIMEAASAKGIKVSNA